VITPPEPSFPTQPPPPVEPPESEPLPAIQIIPFASEEGSHFAVTWTVPEAAADTWYPEVSGDQREWTSDPEVIAVDGPIPEQDGIVRFIAVIREPMPGSYHRFLRLTDTPGWRPSDD
jgi:hypothetical protein